MKVRVLLSSVVLLTTMWLVGCGHYTCGITFGSSTCTPGTNTTPPSSSANAFAYAVDQNGSMDGYALNLTASTFGPISSYTAPVIPANMGSVGVVVAQGKFLYTVLEDSQQIYGWSIGSSGTLTALSNFPVSVPTLSNIAGATYNQQVVITNPAGTLLFISEFADEEILVYQISSTGALTPVVGSPFSTLVGFPFEPQNMAMDGKGRFLYVTEDSGDHSGTFVVGYSVTSTGANAGALTQIVGSPFANTPIWEMQGDPSGNYMIGISGRVAFLYGSDDPNLYVYTIDQTTGALSPAGTPFPFPTVYSPFNIAVQPQSINGEFVYSFSINDADTSANLIEGYQLNSTTGQLKAVAGSPFNSVTTPTGQGQFDQSGNYMFIYSGSATGNSLGVVNVASTGALTETLPTTSLTTGGYWAVTDVP